MSVNIAVMEEHQVAFAHVNTASSAVTTLLTPRDISAHKIFYCVIASDAYAARLTQRQRQTVLPFAPVSVAFVYADNLHTPSTARISAQTPRRAAPKAIRLASAGRTAR